MKRLLFLLILCTPVFASDAPSRAAAKGCAWERFSDAGLGLSAWVQRCDFGFRKIDFVAMRQSLAVRFSDGDSPDPLIDVIAVPPGESHEQAMHRIFAANTPKEVAVRCLARPFTSPNQAQDVLRFTFVPDEAYAAELARTAAPDEVPEPPCGEWGEAPDGIQYFEIHPKSRAGRILFVRVGQDTPLFDEATLQLIEPASPAIPTVELPEALARVLTDYETAWRKRDAAQLAGLFAEDGFVLPLGRPPVHGRTAIEKHYTGQGGPLSLRAIAFAANGNVGYILGGFTTAKGQPDLGKFTLTLRKASDGQWLIVSDMDNPNSMPQPRRP